jgi:shikimate kinase
LELARDRPRAAKIYLVGFMGAGKTTLGRLLAGRLAWPFEDLDDGIERAERAQIATIFAEKGEAYFRQLERRALMELASAPGRAIIAGGGGTFCAPENRAVMQQTGITVWIDQPFECIWGRRDRLTKARPLMGGEKELRALYEKREPVYALATLHLPVADREPDASLEALLRLLAGWCG